MTTRVYSQRSLCLSVLAVAVFTTGGRSETGDPSVPAGSALKQASLPQIAFTGSTRACAGAVRDSTHSIHLRVHVSRDGVPLPHEAVSFSFLNNPAHNYGGGRPLKAARFFDGAGALRATLTRQTDQDGEVALAALSGDVVCRPRLVVWWQGHVIGGVDCDFGAAATYRRFPLPTTPGEAVTKEDDGLLFYRDNPTGPSRIKGKVYLKFKTDRWRGDVKGNWQFVNGHRLRIYVNSVIEGHGTTDESGPGSRTIKDPRQVAAYARVLDPERPGATSCIVTTAHDGAASFRLQTTAKLPIGAIIILGTDDLTQWDEDAMHYHATEPQPQPLLPALAEGASFEWRAPPPDVRGRLLYAEPSESQAGDVPTLRYRWHTFGGTPPAPPTRT